jgi:hypothetical protein
MRLWDMLIPTSRGGAIIAPHHVVLIAMFEVVKFAIIAPPLW